MTKHKLNPKAKNNTLLERAALVVAIVEPLSTVPQIVEVYQTKNVESLSLLSWFLFLLASFIWLAYGIKIKNVPLIASSILWALTELILIAGIIIYS
jgi:uncharacterized protein with PQ loop repeat